MSDDRGSASIWVLAAGLVVVLIATASIAVGEATIARHRAMVAADLGALAGAEAAELGEADACARAGSVVAANEGTLRACADDGLNVTVTVSITVNLGRWRVGTAIATARAGPDLGPSCRLSVGCGAPWRRPTAFDQGPVSNTGI